MVQKPFDIPNSVSFVNLEHHLFNWHKFENELQIFQTIL